MVDTGFQARQGSESVALGTVGAAANAVPQLILALPTKEGEIHRGVLFNQAALAAGDGSNNRTVQIKKYNAPASATVMHTFVNNAVALVNGQPVLMTKSNSAARRFAKTHWVQAETSFAGTGGALTSAFVVAYLVYGLFDFTEA